MFFKIEILYLSSFPNPTIFWKTETLTFLLHQDCIVALIKSIYEYGSISLYTY